ATHTEWEAGQRTLLRSALVPERCATQLVPLDVEITLPVSPTATHCAAASQLTLFRSSPCGLGLSHRVDPSAGRGSAPDPDLVATLDGTAPAIGGQMTVNMSSQPNERNPTLA